MSKELESDHQILTNEGDFLLGLREAKGYRQSRHVLAPEGLNFWASFGVR